MELDDVHSLGATEHSQLNASMVNIGGSMQKGDIIEPFK
jgi:hypothetical protein